MGRLFIDHMGGVEIVVCNTCRTPLTNKEMIESVNYQGSSGKAYLYTRVVNLRYSEVEERTMMTGKHFVRDAYCKVCSNRLGWMYELACVNDQRHKEGKVILETKFIDGWQDPTARRR